MTKIEGGSGPEHAGNDALASVAVEVQKMGDSVKRLQQALARAKVSLESAQQRYKADFDKRIRRARKVTTEDRVYLDVSDGAQASPGSAPSTASVVMAIPPATSAGGSHRPLPFVCRSSAV